VDLAPGGFRIAGSPRERQRDVGRTAYTERIKSVLLQTRREKVAKVLADQQVVHSGVDKPLGASIMSTGAPRGSMTAGRGIKPRRGREDQDFAPDDADPRTSLK
jgi:hypothetical protein